VLHSCFPRCAQVQEVPQGAEHTKGQEGLRCVHPGLMGPASEMLDRMDSFKGQCWRLKRNFTA
jgi:hypothetical protein